MPTTLLALETATDVCSAAVLCDGAVTAHASLHRPRVHAEQLVPLVDNLLDRAAIERADVDAIAASMGPGSYTGLRIGVSTAKGLAMALNAALIGVPTLEALAASVCPFAAEGDVACAFLDARRDEVYAAAYQVVEGDVAPFAPTSARTVDTLPGWLGAPQGTCWLVGDGADKAADVLRGREIPLRVLPPDVNPPSAAWVARRAWPRLQRGATEEVAPFEPYYLKAFAGDQPDQTPFERLSF
jgi:tRNA threonylcarbamoyladenosine biosynthesis protein TsaB